MTEENNTSVSGKSKKLNIAVGFSAMVFSFCLVKFLGAPGFGFMIMMLIFCYLGNLAGKKLLVKNDLIAKIVIFSNFVMWLIPAFGFFASCAAFELTKDRSKYSIWMVVLASISMFLSIVNGIQGVLVGIELMRHHF